MFRVRGMLCISERTGLFTRCRGKVKPLRKRAKRRKPVHAKRRSPARRVARKTKRASSCASKRPCRVFALYVGKVGPEYRCAQFKGSKRKTVKHAPTYMPGTEIRAAEYRKMLKLTLKKPASKGPGYAGPADPRRAPWVLPPTAATFVPGTIPDQRLLQTRAERMRTLRMAAMAGRRGIEMDPYAMAQFQTPISAAEAAARYPLG